MDQSLKILLIDDDEVDRMMARRALTAAGIGGEFAEASDAKTGIRLLAERAFDVALLDHALPDMDGLSAMKAIRAAGITTPVILLTGQGDERLAVEMVRAGASDYLSKTRLSRDLLSHSVRHAIRLHRAQSAALASEQHYRFLAESIPAVVWTALPDGRVDYVNRRWVDLTGLTGEDSMGTGWVAAVHPEDAAACRAAWEVSLREGSVFECELRYRRASDNMYRWHLARAMPFRNQDGHVAKWFGTSTDIEDQKRTRDATTFLAGASVVLASSLDYEQTLGSVAKLAVPAVADWCFVDMMADDGVLRRVAVAHVDAAKVELAKELARRYPLRPNSPVGAPHVVRTGKPVLYEHLSQQVIEQGVYDAEHAAIVTSLGYRSVICVPMIARGRVLGTITLATAETERYYGSGDLALAEDLARRAAASVDNAKLYREAQAAFVAQDQAVALLDTLLDKAPVGLAFFDRAGRYVRINETMAHINGIPVAEHYGKTTEQLLPDVPRRVLDDRRRVLETGEPILNIEITAGTRASDDLGRGFLVSHYPVRSSSGEMLGVGAVVVEITQLRRAEEALQRAKRDADHAREIAEAQKRAAEAANHAKDQFLAVLSHELRTPLTPVLSTVQALESEPSLPSELRDSIDMIRRNVELEARLIDDLLDLTRISKGKLELHLQTTDAHETLGTALDICRSDILDKGLKLEVDLAATKFHVFADSARLHQVFWNLVKNAVKFTPSGGTIRVSTRNAGDDGSRLEVEVRDTGIGIDAGVLPRIFDAFEQGERSITQRFGGLGLGLAISKALIDMQGGQLIAESEGRGRGAAFRVDIAVTAALARRGISGRGPSSGIAARSDVSILLVDDHLDTAIAMRKLLERLGYRITIANTLAGALDSYREQPVDLVISDIGLPDGSGLELIRQMNELRPVRGIALSGFGMEEDVRKSKDAGFIEHLVKPVNFQRLHAIIREVTTPSTADA
jgi:PAS domain S-box-containing protein